MVISSRGKQAGYIAVIHPKMGQEKLTNYCVAQGICTSVILKSALKK